MILHTVLGSLVDECGYEVKRWPKIIHVHIIGLSSAANPSRHGIGRIFVSGTAASMQRARRSYESCWLVI